MTIILEIVTIFKIITLSIGRSGILYQNIWREAEREWEVKDKKNEYQGSKINGGPRRCPEEPKIFIYRSKIIVSYKYIQQINNGQNHLPHPVSSDAGQDTLGLLGCERMFLARAQLTIC